MTQPKFNIGETLYKDGKLVGSVSEIIINQSGVYYVVSNFDKFLEAQVTNQIPDVCVYLSVSDVRALHQFFGDMSEVDWNNIVVDQGSPYDISSRVVSDLPFRLYQKFDDIISKMS